MQPSAEEAWLANLQPSVAVESLTSEKSLEVVLFGLVVDVVVVAGSSFAVVAEFSGGYLHTTSRNRI